MRRSFSDHVAPGLEVRGAHRVELVRVVWVDDMERIHATNWLPVVLVNQDGVGFPSRCMTNLGPPFGSMQKRVLISITLALNDPTIQSKQVAKVRLPILIQIPSDRNPKVLIYQISHLTLKTCTFCATVDHVVSPCHSFSWGSYTNTETPSRFLSCLNGLRLCKGNKATRC